MRQLNDKYKITPCYTKAIENKEHKTKKEKEIITMKSKIRYLTDTEAQVTKAFERQARMFGTEEYKLWRAYREDYPAAKMVTKRIKKNPNKRTYRNLTYDNMRLFIEEKNPALLANFESAKKTAKAQQNPYRAVLAWFLSEFPNYDDYKSFFTTQTAAPAEDNKGASAAPAEDSETAPAAPAERDKKTPADTPLFGTEKAA